MAYLKLRHGDAEQSTSADEPGRLGDALAESTARNHMTDTYRIVRPTLDEALTKAPTKALIEGELS
jgi:hypothetical protein